MQRAPFLLAWTYQRFNTSRSQSYLPHALHKQCEWLYEDAGVRAVAKLAEAEGSGRLGRDWSSEAWHQDHPRLVRAGPLLSLVVEPWCGQFSLHATWLIERSAEAFPKIYTQGCWTSKTQSECQANIAEEIYWVGTCQTRVIVKQPWASLLPQQLGPEGVWTPDQVSGWEPQDMEQC